MLITAKGKSSDQTKTSIWLNKVFCVVCLRDYGEEKNETDSPRLETQMIIP